MIDVNSPAARALRAIQKYDQIGIGQGVEVLYRPLLVEAETQLGLVLGLACTGEREGEGRYDHAGETCPVHEWLVESDEAVAEEMRVQP